MASRRPSGLAIAIFGLCASCGGSEPAAGGGPALDDASGVETGAETSVPAVDAPSEADIDASIDALVEVGDGTTGDATADAASDATTDATTDGALDAAAEVASDAGGLDVGPPGSGAGTCASPIVIDATRTSWSHTKSTASLADASSLSCAGANGRDVVFVLVLDERKKVELDASVLGGSPFGGGVAVALRSTCAGADLECKASSIGATLERELDPGVHYVVVDSGSTDAVDVRLAVSLSPPASPTACLAPKPLVLTSGSAKVTGATTGKTDAADPSCFGGLATADDVHLLELTEPRRVVFTLTSKTPGHEPLLHVRRACADPASEIELGCAGKSSSGSSTARIVRTLGAGKYHVFADGAGTEGAYELDVATSTPKAGEACATAIPLDLTTGSATVTGTTAGSEPDHTCNGLDGPDEVYSFTITEPSRLSVGITVVDEPAPFVMLRSTCDDPPPGAQLICSFPPPAQVLGVAAPGTYYAVLRSTSSVLSGDWKLTVTRSTPIVGETCADPAAFTLGTPQSKVLAPFGHDFGEQGADAAYTFTETTSATRTVTASAPLGKGGGTFEVRRGACSGAGSLLVASGKVTNDGKVVTRTFSSTAGTKYWLVLDTWTDASEMSIRID